MRENKSMFPNCKFNRGSFVKKSLMHVSESLKNVAEMVADSALSANNIGRAAETMANFAASAGRTQEEIDFLDFYFKAADFPF